MCVKKNNKLSYCPLYGCGLSASLSQFLFAPDFLTVSRNSPLNSKRSSPSYRASSPHARICNSIKNWCIASIVDRYHLGLPWWWRQNCDKRFCNTTLFSELIRSSLYMPRHWFQVLSMITARFTGKLSKSYVTLSPALLLFAVFSSKRSRVPKFLPLGTSKLFGELSGLHGWNKLAMLQLWWLGKMSTTPSSVE